MNRSRLILMTSFSARRMSVEKLLFDLRVVSKVFKT